jgi:peroxiredoxin
LLTIAFAFCIAGGASFAEPPEAGRARAPVVAQAPEETTAERPPLAMRLEEFQARLRSLYEQESLGAAELRTQKDALAKEAVAAVRAAPVGQPAKAACLWVVQNLRESAAASEAASILAKTYPLAAYEMAPQAAIQPCEWSGAFLRSLAEANLPEKKRAGAALCLAMHQQALLALQDELKSPISSLRESVERAHGDAFVTKLKGLDGDALAQETVERFEKLRAEQGDLKIGGASIEEHAERAIAAVQRLRLGMPAPETTGKDLEGEPLKLRDFEGKVVLLCFWASWCEPCVAEMRHERELIQRFPSGSFALLGVSQDEDVDLARSTAREAGATWKSFADTDQSLSKDWRVFSLPTYAVVDRDGLLQARGVSLEQAEAAVEHLLREAKSAER